MLEVHQDRTDFLQDQDRENLQTTLPGDTLAPEAGARMATLEAGETMRSRLVLETCGVTRARITGALVEVRACLG